MGLVQVFSCFRATIPPDCPQEDWHGLMVPQETQCGQLGAVFMTAPSGEIRVCSERQGTTISKTRGPGEGGTGLTILTVTSVTSGSLIS